MAAPAEAGPVVDTIAVWMIGSVALVRSVAIALAAVLRILE